MSNWKYKLYKFLTSAVDVGECKIAIFVASAENQTTIKPDKNR